MWSSLPSRYRVTLSVVIIDQLLGNQRSVTAAFITQQWQRLPESDRWDTGFVEMLVTLGMIHLGDLDLQLSMSLKALGAGSADTNASPDATGPHMDLFESILKKYILAREKTNVFVQDLQVRLLPRCPPMYTSPASAQLVYRQHKPCTMVCNGAVAALLVQISG